MIKTVLKPNEFIDMSHEYAVNLDQAYIPQVEKIRQEKQEASAKIKQEQDLADYNGPTVEEIRREAELFKSSFEDEKKTKLDALRLEAEMITNEANERAKNIIKEAEEKAERIEQETEEKTQLMEAEAKTNAENLINEAQENIEKIEAKARKKGQELGYKESLKSSKEEFNRINIRLQSVITSLLDKREEILGSSEEQLIDLILTMSRKVVKTITKNQEDIVIHNIKESLEHLNKKLDVRVRVNLDDLEIVQDNKKFLIEELEKLENLDIIEDSSIDRGGCMIETSFGEIDARINTQLMHIENAILETTSESFQAKYKKKK